MKKGFLIFLGFFSIVIIYTWGIWNTYFAQDEWNGFGLVISLSHKSWGSWFDIIGNSHVIPFAQLFWFVLYKLFGFQAQYFALTAIILHSIATFLVYLVVKKLTGQKFVGFLSALLFATNARAGDAFTLLAVFPATITCFIVIMAYFLYLLHIRPNSTLSIKSLSILLILFLISVMFREDGLILIPLTPIFFLIYNRRVFSKENLIFWGGFTAAAIGFILFRITWQIIHPEALSIVNADYKVTFAYNFITLPIKLVVQNIIEIRNVYLYVWTNATKLYPGFPQSVMDTIFTDFIFLLLFNAFIVVFLFMVLPIREKKFWTNILFCSAWIFVNSFLLATIGRKLFRIDPRYLYLSSFAVNFGLALMFERLWKLKKDEYNLNLLRKTFLLLFFFVLLTSSYFQLQNQIKVWEYQGNIRKSIIRQIVSLHPSIPKKTIFYVECKATCYRTSEFGLPNNLVLPYLSGPGWIFMLQYAQNNEVAYAPFFQKINGEEFLWERGAEGYKRVGDYSFGYFIDKKKLKETITKNKLNKKIVIGLEYDEHDFTIRDMSEKIQREL